MSILCAIPLLSLLFACSDPKVNYETVKITKSIDCTGKAYNQGKITELQITASNITIRRCKINGSIRTIGLGRNGEAAAVQESSIKPGHTARAQAAAPRNVALYGLTITGYGRTPLYLGPGTTNLTLVDSTINGRSDSAAIYLDAESGSNIIRNNTINITGAPREIIAIDGSADNQILTNTIQQAPNGGIYLYRNCGEGGTVRHQSPQRNLIAGNTISHTGGYGIWLGSRNGGRFYCSADDGHPFGSSKDNGDFADDNIIKGSNTGTVRDDGNRNQVSS